jgi:23S rRNA pseudouridine2605 synthase
MSQKGRQVNAKPQNTDKMRIAKYIARAGVASRREAERLITAGRVSVDGMVLTTPAFLVDGTEDIRVDGETVGAPPAPRLWRYHKPLGLITSHKDEQDRPTVFERLPETMPRVISVGRLDLNSEGLLLLTNDGSLARTLELPKTGWTRRYRVRAWGRITQDQLDRLQKGVMLDGRRSGPIEAKIESVKGDNAWIEVRLKEGRNREVRRALESLNMKVNRLIRISYGPFILGNLARGAVDEVRPKQLREQLGGMLPKTK